MDKQLIIDVLDAVEYKYMSTDWSLEKVIKWAKEGLDDTGDSTSYKED